MDCLTVLRASKGSRKKTEAQYFEVLTLWVLFQRKSALYVANSFEMLKTNYNIHLRFLLPFYFAIILYHTFAQ